MSTVSKKPNAKVRKFILKTLIPFVLREHGNGFAMDTWHTAVPPGNLFASDEIERKVPACGMVCCLGGSIQAIKDIPGSGIGMTAELGAFLGLTPEEARGLFYHWYGKDEYRWPAKYMRMFAARKTPLGKAKVACALLTEIAMNGGACLHGKAEETPF